MSTIPLSSAIEMLYQELKDPNGIDLRNEEDRVLIPGVADISASLVKSKYGDADGNVFIPEDELAMCMRVVIAFALRGREIYHGRFNDAGNEESLVRHAGTGDGN